MSDLQHLEARIASQRRTISNLQAALRERNVRTQYWYQGREALLREELARARRALETVNKGGTE